MVMEGRSLKAKRHQKPAKDREKRNLQISFKKEKKKQKTKPGLR